MIHPALRCINCGEYLTSNSLPGVEYLMVKSCESCRPSLEPPDEPEEPPHGFHYNDPFFQALVGHALSGILAQPESDHNVSLEIMTLEKWLLQTSTNAIKYAEAVYFRIKENERLSKP